MPKKNPSKLIRVALVAPVSLGISPGQRFRFESFLPYLENQHFVISNYCYYNHHQWKIIYGPGKTILKIGIILKGFLRRLLQLPYILNADVVYIYRECLPFGPPILEFLISKLFSKRVIYDFDDAIWISEVSDYNKFFGWIKYQKKVKYICKWSTLITVGNNYLAEYAKQFNNNVKIIPTVVDTDRVHNSTQNQNIKSVNIGWTGTFSNLRHLDIVMPTLKRLQDENLLNDFVIICDKSPVLPLKKFSYLPWQKETEINDLLRFHIGLMPLCDDPVTRGKCAFKAIQYMALGMPAVASPVGANKVLLENPENGYLASTDEEWYTALKELLTNTEKRKEIGKNARNHIEMHYSVSSQIPIFKEALIETCFSTP